MKIEFTQPPVKKKSYPEVGDLFTYTAYDNDCVFMRIESCGEDKCVCLKGNEDRIGRIAAFSREDIVLLKQVSPLKLEVDN